MLSAWDQGGPAMNAFYEHHRDSIRFGYRCFDRILLNGLIQRYRIWPVLSHNPCSGPDRGAGDETPRFHNITRRRNGWMAVRWPHATEGDAGDRFSRRYVARPVCRVCSRVPPRTE